jgi:hypothetical protein
MRPASAPDADCGMSMTRQIIPSEIDVSASDSAITIHYSVQLDVFDSKWALVTSRTKPKQLRVVLRGLDGAADLQGLVDLLCEHYAVLAEFPRSQLISAVCRLRGVAGSEVSAADSGARAPSPEQVNDFLHEAPQKIHWGNESECIAALSVLVEIAEFDRNLIAIIHHEPLMNTLVNGLKTFAVTSLSACIKIVSIFERMSYYEHYFSTLGRFKIGAMTLSLLHAQVALKNVADQSLAREKLLAYLKSQNYLLRLTVSLLFNLSENPSTMRKMVNKDIATSLSVLLDHRNTDLLILVLKFLRKIAMVPVNWSAIGFEQICQAITRHIFRWANVATPEGRLRRVSVLAEALELLYSFLFHTETIEVIKRGVIQGIAGLCDIAELRPQLIRIFYKSSIGEGSDEAFRNEKLVNMLIYSTTIACDERLVSSSSSRSWRSIGRSPRQSRGPRSSTLRTYARCSSTQLCTGAKKAPSC